MNIKADQRTDSTPSVGRSAGGTHWAGLKSLDFFAIAAFALLLFGYAGFSGRPLTMHEARLPQCAREMLHRGDWLLPTSGGRPWLERPPLPHWCVIASMKLFGHDDRVWVARLPSAVAGVVTVLLTAWTAGRLFGRTTGIAAALILATSYEFYVYACQAEDDIYLAALVAMGMALFAKSEPLIPNHARVTPFGFFTARPISTVGFFTLLGLTNLTKGPLLGIVFYLGGPAGTYLLVRAIALKSFQPILRFTWIWGWLIAIVLTIAWPARAYHVYPEVLENLKYDYIGRMNHAYTDLNEPPWYYLYQLPTSVLPWTVLLIVAAVWSGIVFFDRRVRPHRRQAHVAAAWSRAMSAFVPVFTRDQRGLLFIAIAAVFPVVLLSVPSGKHHHYLVPCIAPWATLSAVACAWLWQRLFWPKLILEDSDGSDPSASNPARRKSYSSPWTPSLMGRAIFFAVVTLLGIGYSFVQTAIAGGTDHTLDDTAFLLRVRTEVPEYGPLYINAKMGPPGNLDFFRTQFYSRPSAVLLHNLTFLRDDKISAPGVYVICRTKDRPFLATLGTVTQVDQSEQSHEERDGNADFGKFTLYDVRFFPNLKRYSADGKITPLQAMERAPGPWCGPPPNR